MGRMNVVRVLIGGLVAAVIVNISQFVLNTFVIAQDIEMSLRMMRLPTIDNSQVPGFIALGSILGFVTVWLYAALRGRFGPGHLTALYAALTVWLLAYAYPAAMLMVMHVFPKKALAISVVWEMPELVIACVIGSSLYAEGPSASEAASPDTELP